MRKLLIFALLSLILTSCGRHGYWNSFFNRWGESCPGFPPLEESEVVLEKHAQFFKQLEDNRLIHWVDISTCPAGTSTSDKTGSYIAIYHGGEGDIAPVLKRMDEIDARDEGVDRFFGIPFLFVNV